MMKKNNILYMVFYVEINWIICMKLMKIYYPSSALNYQKNLVNCVFIEI